MDSLSIRRLAELTGEQADRLRAWQTLGLLPGNGDDQLDVQCVERTRLIRFAERRGISPEVLAEMSRTHGDLLGQYVGLLAPDGPRGTHELPDVAASSGLDPAFLDRIAAMVRMGDDDNFYDEDVEALATMRTALEAGFPEEAVVQLVRVLTDSLNRVAEAESRLFHFYVHERLRDEGLTGADLVDATQAVNDGLLDLIEPTVLYFHRKGWERALREDLMFHVVQDMTGAKEPGQLRLAVSFVDISSFTPLSSWPMLWVTCPRTTSGS